MARIAGVNLPQGKLVYIALTAIYGIGVHLAKLICAQASIPLDKRVHSLTDSDVARIREVIAKDYLVEGELRREIFMHIKRLMDIGSYVGIRHRRHLPVRGQRTRTNARTRKGKAKPIPGKKMATK